MILLHLSKENKRVDAGLAVVQAVITLVLVVLSFSLGFVIGDQRGKKDANAPARAASLEEILKQELDKKSSDLEKEKEFEFYKRLKEEAKEGPAARNASLPAAKVATKKKTPEPKPAAKTEESVERQKKLAEIAAKTGLVESKPQLSAPPKVAGKYTLQVGSFRTAESAQRLLADLKDKKVDGFITKVEIAGKGEWYRVRVGQFDEHELAARAARQLQNQTGKSSLITKLDLK